jgi:hypothetical protein
MSNVLIGIIGVILFIGLALAGALFLGPRFQESTNNSKGSAAVQAVSQVASAANMYNVQEGGTITNGDLTATNDLVAKSYLKSVPGNPNGTGVIKIAGTAPNQVVTMVIDSDSVCQAIARQSGQTLGGTATAPASPTTAPTSPTGCYSNAGAFTVQAKI